MFKFNKTVSPGCI
ncbi:hypothetical protein MXB_2612 [Myxobolus squamalis]|nr:hypothetical protein MXB_2612 [Myxobolus squamalis]